ncbi:hypothetical protein HGE68_06810 [Rhodobacteraceae bacterium R_SAG6]|nr:hypothetical protein [Rhodobacteraceae bacterium R_SAG6]
MASTVSHRIVITSSDLAATTTAEQVQRIMNAERHTTTSETLRTTETVTLENLDTAEDVEICFLYSAPETIIRNLFDRREGNAEALNGALEVWAEDAMRLLELYRPNRGRAILFETSHLQKFFALGVKKLNLNFTDEKAVSLPAWLEYVDPVLLAMVSAYVRDHSQIRTLYEELYASSQVLCDDHENSKVASMAAALSHYYTQQKSLTQLEESNALVTQQNQLMIEELQQLEHIGQTLSIEVKNTRQRLAISEEARKRGITNGKQTTGTMEPANELAPYLPDELTRQEEHIRYLEAEIHRIMTSRSMRMTQPLRKLGRFLRNGD